jgi:type VI secretion system secreted protein Hcp
MPIYIKYGSIKGEVTAPKWKEWFEVDSFQWGIGRAISQPSGGGVSKRESSTPSVSEITVSKATDGASTDLLKEVLGAKMDNKVNIDFTRTGTKGAEEPWLQLTLTDTAVSGFSMSSGGDRANESITLNYTKIEVKYTSYDDKGTAKPASVTYDLTTRGLT